MIWLTWRQFRASALVLVGAVGAAAVVLAVTEPQLASLSRTTGESFLRQLGNDRLKVLVFYTSTFAVYLFPAVVGVFWGAPMVARELESGTHRLVWNQGITRTRWLATKLAVAAAGAAGVGLFALALTWWCRPLDDAVAKGYAGNGLYGVPRLWPSLFGARGIVPIGMVILALVIGVAVGLVLRRAVPAMAVTLVAVIAVQVIMPTLVQAHPLPSKHFTTTITRDRIAGVSGHGEPGRGDMTIDRLEISVGKPAAWITFNRTIDKDGKVVSPMPAWVNDCVPPPGVPTSPASGQACFDRLESEGYRQRVEYFPASRFWPLQLIETGLLLALAALVTGFCFWRIRRDFA